jgi:hypothetical protein
LKEEQFKVLKTMGEATSRMDLKMFAAKVDLTQSQTLEQFQELTKKGFLRAVGQGYGITEKGKMAIKALTPVPEEKSFQFYASVDKSLGLTARTLAEFCRLAKQVSYDSLEFHLDRGDFEKWLKEVQSDPVTAEEVDHLKESGLKGESLRKELWKILDTKYCIEEFS